VNGAGNQQFLMPRTCRDGTQWLDFFFIFERKNNSLNFYRRAGIRSTPEISALLFQNKSRTDHGP
jgi:hypothetical protein